jgi:hypothetical protein
MPTVSSPIEGAVKNFLFGTKFENVNGIFI